MGRRVFSFYSLFGFLAPPDERADLGDGRIAVVHGQSHALGTIMAVPGHDARDWDFAKKFNLPIIEVVAGGNVQEAAYVDVETGTLVNSGFLDGLEVEEAKKKMLFACRDGEILPGTSQEMSGDEWKKRMRGFHDEIYAGYREIMSGDKNTLFKMKELWSYMGESFPGAEKQIKQIKKANRLSEYENAVNTIFLQ